MVKLDGIEKAKEIRERIQKEVEDLKEQHGQIPGLVVIIVGEDSASKIYVRTKEKISKQLNFTSEVIRLDKDVDEDILIKTIKDLNENESIDGILVQTPLPDKFDTWKILDIIKPAKDVDRFHPLNLGLIVLKRTDIFPCTPAGILKLLELYNISVSGLNVIIIGRSFIVGKPLAAMLTNRDATVTICHTKTKDLKEKLKRADMIIAAVGRVGMIKAEMVREGVILIDVGINYLTKEEDVIKYCSEPQKRKFLKKGYAITGDITQEAFEKSSYYTPVPGGIGRMTVAMLMENTLTLFKKYRLNL